MSERAEGVESFPVTADPDNYVQTTAAEDALDTLYREIGVGTAPVVLVGTAGVGKTMVLRVLERRLVSSLRIVYLPFAALPADELCTWILGLLGQSPGRDPERDLLAAGLRLEETGSALVVMLDDAGSMPVATARRLSALFAEAEGALRLVLALSENSRSDQMLSCFQPAATRVELRTLMNAEETSRYLRAHLTRSDAPQEIRARFDPTSVRYLHRGSGGVPRVLNGLAGEVVRGNLSVLPRHETAARDEPLGFGPDPFDVTSDPAYYVPREATQDLLDGVESSLRKGARAIAVTGPPGLGKTMLLRVLERRLRGGYRPLRISYTALLPDEFCRWILTLEGEPAAQDAEAALLELVRRLARSRTTLVLLLDDAGSIPIPTVRRLVELAGEADGAMRVVLFAADDVRTARILDALGADAVMLRFSEPMSEDETAAYIHARLDRAIAPTALVERFDPEVVAQLHVDSAGIPREIHRLVGALFRDGADAVAAPAATPELSEAQAGSEPQAPPPPTGPSEAVASEPEPIPETAPVPRRLASRGRVAVFGLLVAAVLLAAVPLLRGGLPWKSATQRDDPVAMPPAAPPPREMPAPLAPEASGEPIPVNVNATPWASIEVDGRYLGTTPLAGVLLPPGPHVFRARMADGEIREHRVEVGATMRHVVFYAEVSPEEIELAPETAAALAPPPPVPQELPEVALELSRPLEKEVPETAVAPERVASAREPEPAPPPPAPEPEVAAAIAPPSPVLEERPEITVGPSQPPQEEVPEVAAVSEQVASVREPASPPPAPRPISVSINATPWATIEIDGEEIGVTPMAGVLLAPGEHAFRARMPDGKVLEETVRIAPDNRHIAFAP